MESAIRFFFPHLCKRQERKPKQSGFFGINRNSGCVALHTDTDTDTDTQTQRVGKKGGVTSWMAAKFASWMFDKFVFCPPKPPSYTVVADDMRGVLLLSTFPPHPHRKDAEVLKLPTRKGTEVLKLPTRKGTEVVAVYFKYPMATTTLLYSHGNASDMGQMYLLFILLSIELKVNVMGYDYSGYGQSSGKPSVQNMYADIDAVYKCLEESYGVKQEDLILYGQSVGSGPTLDLAARLPKLRAVVLRRPILSGLRVIYPVKCWFDIHKIIDKIPLVTCPVLIIHGTADDDFVERNMTLWIKGGNHCDQYRKYIDHLRKFVSFVEKPPSQRHFKEEHRSV